MRGRAEFEQLTGDEGRMECRFVFCVFLFHDAFEAGNEHTLGLRLHFIHGVYNYWEIEEMSWFFEPACGLLWETMYLCLF